MIKRAYIGVFHRSPEHLHRYVAELEGKHNARDLDTAEQMGEMVRGGDSATTTSSITPPVGLGPSDSLLANASQELRS